MVAEVLHMNLELFQRLLVYRLYLSAWRW